MPGKNAKKLIILDPSLKNTGGHFYEYDAAIAAAALLRHWQIQIYAHKSREAGLAIAGSDIQPWFFTEWSAAGGRMKASARLVLGSLPAAMRIPLGKFGRQIWKGVKRGKEKREACQTARISAGAEKFGHEAIAALQHAGCSSDDIIFLPTIRTSELYALWKLVQASAELSHLQFHIVLRRDAAEMDLPEDGAPGISFLFQKLRAAPAGRSFHFYCDTQQLCEDYALLSDGALQFRLLPIPFPNPEADSASLEKWSAGAAVKLVYLGGARVEKGFHLIAAAEKNLREKSPGPYLWRLQAPTGGGMEEPEVIAARRSLLSAQDGSVDLVERNLSPGEFQSLMLSADIVLLPYLPEFYRARSSGILVQALAAGKPVIVPAGCWLSDQTRGLGAVEFKELSSFPAAVLQAAQRLAELSREAKARAPAFAAFHNADRVMAILERGRQDE